jgi:hypothetical protein
MAGDQRDWYREWWRKRTGYVERASFRVSEADRRRERNSALWQRNLWGTVGVLLVIWIVSIAVKHA